MNKTIKKTNHMIKLALLVAALVLIGCDPGTPDAHSGFSATGHAAPLSQAEFNALPAEQRYEVASKLYGTFFRGISAENFFNLSTGTDTLSVQSHVNSFLSNTRSSLSRNLSPTSVLAADTIIEGLDSEGNPREADAKYSFDTDSQADRNERPMQLPLAHIKEYPISHNLFVQWMAYVLSNTIMFSPGFEMESTDTVDAQNMYRFLVTKLSEGASVRDIIRSNLQSLARWRISRSSENHALEAYELYLGLFETEIDSIRGGIACKDFYLTDEASGYVLATTNRPNTEPQLILDSYFITTCSDLYDVVAGHPLVMPRTTEVLVNYVFSGRSRADRVNIINSIVDSGAETFEDIFTAMLFSKEYLLNTERPRSFEERLFPLLDTLQWDPAAVPNNSIGKRIFEAVASGSTNPPTRNDILYLGNKGWHSMTLKIGRLPDVPLDALSLANYHKGVREQLLLLTTSYSGRTTGNPGLIYNGMGNDDDDLRPVVAGLDLEDYVHFLFLNTLHRKANTVEMDGLIAIYESLFLLTVDTDGNKIIRPSTSDNRHDNIASVTLDYISRLPEFYYFNAVQ